MVCIYCGEKLAISNSRHQKRSNSTWRRRKCPSCRATITTIEAVDYPRSLVICKPDGTFTAFSRDRLFVDVYDSLKHRKNAINDATSLTDTIVNQTLAKIDTPRIDRQFLINQVTETLNNFDKVAAIHYSAYHRPNK